MARFMTNLEEKAIGIELERLQPDYDSLKPFEVRVTGHVEEIIDGSETKIAIDSSPLPLYLIASTVDIKERGLDESENKYFAFVAYHREDGQEMVALVKLVSPHESE